jgi:hypothetical protein
MQLFWAEALGLEPVPDDGGTLDLVGPTSQHRVWINKVTEPVTVKQRVHIDLHVASTDDVLALGATPVDLESFRWDVLRDPEGGELCTFPREEVPAYKLYEVVVDSVDAHAIGAWWAEVLGATLERADEDEASFSDAPGMPFELASATCRSPRRSRTASTGTSRRSTSSRWWTAARPCSVAPTATSATTSWPTRRATSSA